MAVVVLPSKKIITANMKIIMANRYCSIFITEAYRRGKNYNLTSISGQKV